MSEALEVQIERIKSRMSQVFFRDRELQDLLQQFIVISGWSNVRVHYDTGVQLAHSVDTDAEFLRVLKVEPPCEGEFAAPPASAAPPDRVPHWLRLWFESLVFHCPSPRWFL